MRPYIKDSFLNEAFNHSQNQNPRFFRGGSYRHYFDKPSIQTEGYFLGNEEEDLGLSYTRFGNPELEPWNQANSRTRDGSHAGKGPKFYRRSDASIQEDVCEELTQHPYLDASEIEVKVEKSIVTLTGTVPNRQMKRLAETCTDHIRGVHDVLNHLQAGASIQK